MINNTKTLGKVIDGKFYWPLSQGSYPWTPETTIRIEVFRKLANLPIKPTGCVSGTQAHGVPVPFLDETETGIRYTVYYNLQDPEYSIMYVVRRHMDEGQYDDDKEVKYETEEEIRDILDFILESAEAQAKWHEPEYVEVPDHIAGAGTYYLVPIDG